MRIEKEDDPELDRVFEIMDEIVARVGPDYTYSKTTKMDGLRWPVNACWYLDDNGNCSCLIGHVMRAMGWTDDEIDIVEGSTPMTGIGYNNDEIPQLWRDKFRQATLFILNEVQMQQDIGLTWARSVEYGRSQRLAHSPVEITSLPPVVHE